MNTRSIHRHRIGICPVWRFALYGGALALFVISCLEGGSRREARLLVGVQVQAIQVVTIRHYWRSTDDHSVDHECIHEK